MHIAFPLYVYHQLRTAKSLQYQLLITPLEEKEKRLTLLPNMVASFGSAVIERTPVIVPVKMEKNTIPIIIQQIVTNRPATDFGALSP
jgi:hypothetical protein